MAQLGPWLRPVVGFLLSSLGLTLGHPLTRGHHVLGDGPVGLAAPVVGLALAEVVLMGIIWIWFGSKLFRGPISAGESVKGVGSAVYLPSAGLLLVVSVPYQSMRSGDPVALALSAAMLLFTIWALVRIASFVRRANRFGRAKTLGVMLWPIVPVALVVLPFELFVRLSTTEVVVG
jgi:hypothetical protein